MRDKKEAWDEFWSVIASISLDLHRRGLYDDPEPEPDQQSDV